MLPGRPTAGVRRMRGQRARNTTADAASGPGTVRIVQGGPTEQRGRGGVGWVVTSAVVLVAGTFAWVVLSVVGDFGPGQTRPSLGARALGSVVIAVVTIGFPTAVGVVHLTQRRRGAAIRLGAPIACLVIAVLGIWTVGFASTGVVVDWASDHHRRAQPLSAVETSRTQAQAARDLDTIGAAAVGALGADLADEQVLRSSSACPLSNEEWGAQQTWEWRTSTIPEGVARTDEELDASLLGRQEVARRTAAARAVLEDAGLTQESVADRSATFTGKRWLDSGYLEVTTTDTDVTLQTRCLAGQARR